MKFFEKILFGECVFDIGNLTMFGFGDKRKSYLKDNGSPFAQRALELYCGGIREAYLVYISLDNTDSWKDYKNWLLNWISPEEINSDAQLAELYIEWFQNEFVPMGLDWENLTRSRWSLDNNDIFDEIDSEGSNAHYFMFAAYIESYQIYPDEITTQKTDVIKPNEENEKTPLIIELEKLKELFESGLIDENEYSALKKRLLDL